MCNQARMATVLPRTPTRCTRAYAAVSVIRFPRRTPPSSRSTSFSTPSSLSHPPIGFVTAMSRGHWSANSRPLFQPERTECFFFFLIIASKGIHVRYTEYFWTKVAKLRTRQNRTIENLMKHTLFATEFYKCKWSVEKIQKGVWSENKYCFFSHFKGSVKMVSFQRDTPTFRTYVSRLEYRFINLQAYLDTLHEKKGLTEVFKSVAKCRFENKFCWTIKLVCWNVKILFAALLIAWVFHIIIRMVQ